MMHTTVRRCALALTGLALAACADQPMDPAASPELPSAARVANLPPTAAHRPVGKARFSNLNALEIPVSARVAGAMAAVSNAPPGTLVKTFVAANPDNCGVQTGIAYDGTNLMMSCWYNNRLDVLSSSNGTLIKRLQVPGVSGINALAWDGQQQRLWACADGYRIYLIDTSDPDGDGIVAPGEVSFRFNTNGCYDGLAYDGADQTLWYSSDVESYVHHVTRDGAVIDGPHYIVNLLGNYGSSGIAVGGGSLYLANNGGSQIYVTDKPPTTSALFATFPRRIEDLECDDITFRADGIAAIWQQDAYDREVQAYAIAPGACPFGGFDVPQTVMDIQPGRLSVASSPVVNVVLLSNALFDAAAANLGNLRFVVNGNTAVAAPVARRGAAFMTSVSDYNRDGRPDRMVVFTMASLRAAGLTAGATNLRVQDVTSGANRFQATDTVNPAVLP